MCFLENNNTYNNKDVKDNCTNNADYRITWSMIPLILFPILNKLFICTLSFKPCNINKN